MAIACALAAVAAAPTVLAGASSRTTTPHATKTLTVWLGGSFGYATPGTTTLTWVKDLITAFQSQHPGVHVKYSLLPTDNAMMIAELDAAFTSGHVPDVLANFSGSFTEIFEPELVNLHKFITPAFYKSMNSWSMSCANYQCKNGAAAIYGVPIDMYAYLLYYNKALFAKAHISSPPKTYSDLYKDCTALKGKGILPIADGDASGYTTSNFFDEGIASYLTTKQVLELSQGKLKWTNSSIVDTFAAIAKLRKMSCVPANASTTDQTDGTNPFTIGRAAMVEMYPQMVPAFEKSLGKKLGLAPLPSVANGAVYPSIAAGSADSWNIPRGSKNQTLAWEFVSLASNYHLGLLEQQLVGYPSTNDQALAHVSNSYVEAGAKLAERGKIPMVDDVIKNALSLDLYKECALIFAGLVSPQAGAAALQQEATSIP
jgi:ABC-type glycerol-3-phosphate transport system substrate-binding protein